MTWSCMSNVYVCIFFLSKSRDNYKEKIITSYVVTLSTSTYLKIKIGLSLYSGPTFIIPNGILFNRRADAWMVAGRGEVWRRTICSTSAEAVVAIIQN